MVLVHVPNLFCANAYLSLSLQATPTADQMAYMQTPEQQQAQRWEAEIDERNRPITDEELDAIFPKDG
jgi:hypothetical protein